MIIPRSFILRMRDVSDKRCGENQIQFTFNNSYSEIVTFLGNIKKYCTAGQATDDNTAHAHCMLNT